MKKVSPYFRQIHLDFHTSEHIPGIGEDFSEEQFAEALKIGHVDSINFFAMGHHGWCYYPTKTDMAHPHLKTDLVGGMMSACKKAGVNPVVYITVGWNDKAAREHPEWCIRKPDGRFDGPEKLHPASARSGGWYRLCFNTPYLDEVVLPVTREVMDMYSPNGIWFDITGEYECTCEWCTAGMIEDGLDPTVKVDRKVYAKKVYKNYLEKTTDIVWGAKPEAWIYHNGSDKKGRYDLYPYWSHYEIESLPTGGWGYDHFPPNARYFTVVPDTFVVSMTGKFHKMWGEFGGFKNPTALRYETAQIMSLCCAACVGDQLHPRGVMDPETYRIIGEAYKDIEARQAWLEGARPVADVAILSPEGVAKEEVGELRVDECEVGASKVLMEGNIPHAVLDGEMDFSPYKVLVVPDIVRIDETLATKLKDYVASGGSLILSGVSGMSTDSDTFAVDVGAEFEGFSPWDIEYINVGDEIADNMVRSPFLVYHSGVMVKPTDAKTLAQTWQPYFSRTHGHFCSHGVTPPEKDTGKPAVIRKGQVIYISQPIFRSYAEQGMQLHRDLVLNCLGLLYPQALLETNLPSGARVSIARQPDHNRDIIHLLYAVPVKRGAVEVIEDVVPLHDVSVRYRTEKPKKAYLAPTGEEISFTYEDGAVSLTIGTLLMHEMVVLEY